MKAKKEYKIVPRLPKALEPLKKMAYNVVFSWQSEIRDLFMRMDPKLWTESRHNPVLMLGLISQDRLEELSEDHIFLAQLNDVDQRFERYISRPHLDASAYGGEDSFLVAYLATS